MPQSIPTKRTSHWGFLFALLVFIAVVLSTALVAVPDLARELGVLADRVLAPVLAAYREHIPIALQPAIAKAAAVFLTPWLYVVMLFVFVAERWIPADPSQRVLSIGMLQDFVAWFTLDGLVRMVVIGTLVPTLYFLYHNYLDFLTVNTAADWPAWLQVTAALLAVDFLNWFHHWLRHKVPLFWIFHAVHHSQRQLNMFTDLRVHFVEHLVTKPIVFLPLFMLNLDVEPAFWIVLFRDWYSRIYHANLRTNFGALRYVLVTPQSHRIHHSVDPRHRDRNFGVVLSVWDRLFGTQWPDASEYPATGIEDPRFPHEQDVRGARILTNYLRQLAYPFTRAWDLLRQPPAALATVGPAGGLARNPRTQDESQVRRHVERP